MRHGFFAYIARMKFIRRWALMRCTIEENVAEHSLQTAMIAHALALIAKNQFGEQLDAGSIAAAALYHDASEVITGDMPTPVKYYNPEIRTTYKEIESIANEKLLTMLPEALRPDYRGLLFPQEERQREIIKAADKIAAYLKCLEEKSSGNLEFADAEANTLRQIEAMYVHPEVRYFMENFADSFAVTLDKLK